MTTHFQIEQIGPVSGSVCGEREALDIVMVDAIIQSEENSEACLRKNGVRRLEFNVILRDRDFSG